ncbi:GntR family transcriptional regulator (plasmid) [Priestia filamentosa]|uniref:GntR family transcriptional regulator n=1 Tax=Priestia filamentosa TaxID=1402861 RepID=A0A231S012_9BACI|nr:PLP-dependent aminotransferase family protein [Priestia filamentosa]AWG44667.1 GntR family transcriptional regulator [Priestia filamentosa]OXS65052.1 GntR family transcriptional regulator [Priestia filamentosa]
MMELTPNLDSNSKEPLYIQLYNFIRQEIEIGNLVAYTKLPSKRKLSKNLQISQNTIEAAYEQLVAEGYIEGIPRKGYFVCKVDQTFSNLKESIIYIKEETYEDNVAFDFTQTGVDGPSFPFSIFRKISNDVLRDENKHLLRIGHPQGEYGLREAIASYLYESRGVRTSPSQIIIGSGTPTLIRLLFKLLKGSLYAVEDPGYHQRLVTFEKGYENVRLIPLDDDGMVVSKLEDSSADIAFVTPSHQFPCGMIMSIARRNQLLNWAQKKEERYIVEDDYDSEFRYSGKPIPALQGLDSQGRVIYMGTFSKALLPSLRISYMVLPKPLIEKYHENHFRFVQSVSRLDQEVLKRFMQEGYWKKHINKMRVVYSKKRDVLVSAISTYFPDSIEIIGLDAGLHLLVRPNNGMTEQELIERAAKYGIKVYSVSEYGKNDYQTIMLGFAVLSEKEIPTAIQLLVKAWMG